MIRQYGVTLISVGNGTASRESEQFIVELLKEIPGRFSMSSRMRQVLPYIPPANWRQKNFRILTWVSEAQRP